MSFNLALHCQSIPQSPTSSSTSSLDDGVNNPAARVYFGPIQSPERILMAEATHKRNNNLTSMPVRRSPRISVLHDSQQLDLEEEEAVEATLGEQGVPKAAPPSTAPAPDPDSSQDGRNSYLSRLLLPKMLYEDIDIEPPSALVTKISRAHDNPSPPPLMQPLGQESDNPTLPTHSEPHPLSDSASLKAPDSAVADGPSCRAQTSIPSPTSHELFTSLDNRPGTSLASNVFADVDLIVFDDDNLPDVPKVASVVEPFPDLLAPTPLRQPGPFLRGLRSTSPTTLPNTQTCSARNEGPNQDSATPSKVANTSAASNLPPTESVVQLRRSPRFLQPGSQLDSPSFHSGQSSLVPGDKAEPPDTYSSLTDMSSSETTGHNVMTEPPHQVRELGSLSPVSEDVLHNLLSTTEAITTAPLDQIPALASVFPANQPPRDRPSTPEQNDPVAIHSVQRPPPERSPWRSHIANPASPSKFGFNHTLHDPNRTPARRIPIKKLLRRVRFRLRRVALPDHLQAYLGGLSSPVLHQGTAYVAPFDEHPLSQAHNFNSTWESAQWVRRTSIFEKASSGTTFSKPSSMAGSRIPRIGVKPYTRPPEKEKQKGEGKEPVHKLFVTKRPTSGSAPTKPVRLVRNANVTGSGSSSEGFVDFHTPALGAPSSSQTSSSTIPQPSPSLKRKRSLEEIPLPQATQPTFARLVTSMSRQKPSFVLPAPTPDSRTAAKKTRIGHVRTVVGDVAAQKHAACSPGTQASADETAKAREQPRTCPVSTSSESRMAPLARPPTPPPDLHTVPEQSIPLGMQAELASPPDIQPTRFDASSSNCPSDSPLSSTTRVRRSRRNPQPTADVFGPVRPLPSRRRHPAETPGGGTFSSMSALALKALTTSNTEKNQHNLVAILETEVVRKPGNRPGSPTTRIKTIDEKRKLEQDQERRERAERRARRSSQPLEDSRLTCEDEESLPVGPDGQPLRHRRGPGDEEAYESPERIYRPEKRARIGEAGEPEEVETKAVRWDRGLFTMIYFDDLPLKSREGDKPQASATHTKGALAGSAKALQLDSLGNLVHATSPLKDLVQENVVIKKYVYDDDAEAAEIDAPKPLSKGKNRKSKG
ncbi:hypothetical protein BJV74DRAFT_792435 [Russula compacta]|nr:hypothetical protein BJV74DRAFT_792435 [Russula compacta]